MALRTGPDFNFSGCAGFEPKALYAHGKCSTAELYPSPLFLVLKMLLSFSLTTSDICRARFHCLTLQPLSHLCILPPPNQPPSHSHEVCRYGLCITVLF